MREGWKKILLGDICKINSGKTIKANEIHTAPNKELVPCYGGNGIRGYVKNVSHDGIFPIVGRVGALCGNVHLANGRFYATEHALVFTLKDNSAEPHFLAQLLKAKKLGQYAKGVAQPVISAGELSKLSIIIPPKSTQLAIVSELDKINELIRLKKEQLVEYDNLAQSIFYEMFGDPVENEKGWEVKKFINVVTLQRGYDLPTQQRDSSGSIPVYGSNGILSYHNESKLDCGIITGRSGTIGEVYISKTPCWPLNTTLYSKETHGNNLIYLCYFLRFFDLKRFVQGAGVPTLNRNNFHEKMIMAPPLPLQQSFASRIEQIEKLKTEVQKAINNLETLLASRMQYWFD